VACVRFLVSGRVQGVFFRASTREQAARLKLNGHARNLDDGSVEVVACGEHDALAELERWLQRGPPAARVVTVKRYPSSEVPEPGFRTL